MRPIEPIKHHNQTHLKVLFALTLVHFTGDFYSAFTTPLFPAFMDKLNLTLAQVGLWLMLARLLDVASDALAARLCDRSLGPWDRRGWMVLGALLLARGR